MLGVIKSAKKKKTAGPDKLYNEYHKAIAYGLADTWTLLYNKCLEQATVSNPQCYSTVTEFYKSNRKRIDSAAFRGRELQYASINYLLSPKGTICLHAKKSDLKVRDCR
jgi:hypothetical protein